MKLNTQNKYTSRLTVILALLVLLFCTNNTFSQNINNLRFWGSSNGLFNKITHAIVKDNNGYMWLGTQNGLIRFDGQTFIDINEINPNEELAGAKINCLLVVNDSVLWAGTDNGLFSINLHTFFSYKICLPAYNNKCSVTYRILSLYKTKSSYILIGSETGLVWLLHNNTYNIISNPYSKSKLFENIGKFAEAPYQKVWFNSGQNKIFCIDLITKKTIASDAFNQDVYRVAFTNSEGLIVNMVNGLYQYNSTTKKLSNSLTKGVKNLFDILIESDNSFWVTHFVQGLYLYDNNAIKNFSSVFNIIGENNSRVTSIYKSNSNIWIGTNYGLIKFTNSPNTIKQFFSNKNSDNTYPFGGSVRGICELKDRSLLFATYKGLFKSEPPYKSVTEINHKEKFKLFPYTFCVDNDVVWIGTEGTGLIKFNPKNNHFDWVSRNVNPSIEPRFITSITNDIENDRLLIGTYLGLIIYNKKPNTFERFSLNTAQKRYDQTTINQILKIDGKFWFATNFGLFITDNKLKKLPTPPVLKQLTHYSITKIVYDSNTQTYWIGTLGKGLWKYNTKTNTIVNYNRELGLPNDNIASIIYHNEHSILIGTFNGLCKLNPKTGLMTNLYTENGLSHNEFNLQAAYKTSDGLIFMGGLNGYNIIDNDIDKYSKLTQNNLYISKMYIHNGEKEKNIYYTPNNTTITLPPNNKTFDLEFGISDYTQTDNNIYSYKIEGKDKDWNYIGNRNYLRFTDLEPGNYKLLINATAANGSWLTTPFTINLVVHGYFYKTWWFTLLIFVAIITIIVGFYKSKLDQLKKLANLRLQISSDLHDEVGSILTAVGMQAEMLRTEEKSGNQIALNKIAETSRTAVSNMRDVVWSIDSRNDKYSDLIDRMHEYISLVVDNENIDCVFEKNIENINTQLDLVIRQNLYLLFKEALNNIVKHANASKINIHLTLNSKLCYFTIQSNGTQAVNNSYGMGMKNMEMRAQKMKATLIIDKEHNYKITLSKHF